MKRSFKLLIKGLFIIILFTVGSIALSTTGVKTVSEANAAVSYQTVYSYLVAHGYMVVTLNPAPGDRTENWLAHTTKNGVHYWSTVYVSGTAIVNNTDVPM